MNDPLGLSNWLIALAFLGVLSSFGLAGALLIDRLCESLERWYARWRAERRRLHSTALK